MYKYFILIQILIFPLILKADNLADILKASVKLQNQMERLDVEKTKNFIDKINTSLDRINKNISVNLPESVLDMEIDECVDLPIEEMICEDTELFYDDANTCKIEQESDSISLAK